MSQPPDLTDTVRDLPVPDPAIGPLPRLIDLLPDPVLAFDRREQVVAWNRAAAALYGLPADSALRQSVLLFVPHDRLAGFALACEAVRRAGAWAGELVTQTATGNERVVEARWTAAGPTDDPAAVVLAVHTDVTDRRRLADRADRAARWDATRGLAAAIAGESARGPEWAAQIRKFARGPDPVAAGTPFHGAGDGVLVAASSPVLRELARALFEAAGYAPVTAPDRFEAVRVAATAPGRLRAAVLAFGEDNPAVAGELRRVRPLLPVVAVGPPAEAGPWVGDDPCTLPPPVDPLRLLRAVAEAVAADRLTEAGLYSG